MKGFFMKQMKHMVEQEGHSSRWIDEELDSDGLDLEEWAFMQGYYQDN